MRGAGAQPVAPARGLGDGDDLRAQLTPAARRPAAGTGPRPPAARAGRGARPGPSPAPARRPRSSRPGASSPGRRPGGRRRRWQSTIARARTRRRRAGEQQHAAARAWPTRTRRRAAGAGAVELGAQLRARLGRERARRGLAHLVEAPPPDLAAGRGVLVDQRRPTTPARRAARAAAIPAGPPPTTATSTCFSSLTGRAYGRLTSPYTARCRELTRRHCAICRNLGGRESRGPYCSVGLVEQAGGLRAARLVERRVDARRGTSRARRAPRRSIVLTPFHIGSSGCFGADPLEHRQQVAGILARGRPARARRARPTSSFSRSPTSGRSAL